MRMASRLAGMAFLALGANAVARGTSSSDMAMLLPGSPDLTGTHFTNRCTDVVRFARAAGEQVEKQAGAQRVTEASTTYRGKPAVWLITSGQSDGAWVDSALIYRDGLAPIVESFHSGKLAERYEYDGARVRVTHTQSDSAPVIKQHAYATPVFSFQQLDAVIRSLPLRRGYEAVLPLYSEGDDSVEVDTVQVVSRAPDGVWQVRFADPAIVATVRVQERTRAQVGYEHTFRQAGPSWKPGMVWRQTYTACRG
ncbi:MAG: hypothetical protein U0132_08665 [Gemmatimonadaceae bacterium]